MKLTLEEAVRLHRELWSYISENIDDCIKFTRDSLSRGHFINLFGIWKSIIVNKVWKEPIVYSCFLCEYATSISSSFSDRCMYCPLNNIDDINHSCLNGLYSIFLFHLYHHNRSGARNIALEIANLPIINKREEINQ